MTFWVTANFELDTYFSILWFDHVVLSFEINQARSSPSLALSFLAAFTHDLIGLLGGGAVEVDIAPYKSFIGRIGTILHRSSCWNFDSTAPVG